MAGSVWFVLAIVFVALIFDFINGFHDAANSIATVVSTLVLTLTVALSWALRRSLPRRVDRTFRVLQFFSAAAFSLGHGTNDAQKTMGIIVGLLVAEQALFVNFPVRAFHITAVDTIPLWIIISAGAAIGLGTVSGGWRVVKTMGPRLTKLTPVGGFCAETSGAITLFVASHLGIPLSTTPTN